MNQRLMMIILTTLFLFIEGMIVLALKKHGNRDYMHAVSVYMAVWLIYSFLEIKFKLYINNYLRSFVFLILISSSFFGYYLNFYVTSPFYDRIQHILGTYGYTLFLYSLIRQVLQLPHFSGHFTFLFAFSLGVSLGVLFELIEFSTDTLFNPSTPGQPNLRDTNLDLVANVLGSLLAGLHLGYKAKKQAGDL